MDSPSPSSTPSQTGTPRKLENMSQEDLVKNCKKQMIFIQKLKAKSDDLQAKLKKQVDYDEIKQNHATLLDQNEKLQTEKTAVEKAKSSLSEELECLQMKQETLMSSLQCMQDDFTRVTNENKQLRNDADLTQKRVAVLKQKFKEMQIERQDLSDQLTDNSQQLLALKSHIKKLSESEHQLTENNETLSKENETIKSELSAVKISLQFFEEKKDTSSDMSSEIISELRSDAECLQSKLSALTAENDQLQEKITALEDDKNNVNANFLQLQDLVKSVQSELQQEHKNVSCHETTIQNLKEGHLLELNEISEKLKLAMNENKDIVSEMSKLQAEKKDQEIKMHSLEEKCSYLQNEATLICKQNTEVASKLAQKVSDESKELEESKSEIDALKVKLQNSMSETSILNTKLDKLEKEQLQKETLLCQSLDEVNEEFTTLKQQFVEAEKKHMEEKDRLNTELQQLQETVETQANELANQTKACEELTLLHEQTKSDFTLEKERADCSAQRQTEIVFELEEAKQQMENLKSEIVNLQAKEQSLTDDFQTFKSENTTLASELNEALSKISSLQTEKSTLENVIDEQNDKEQKLKAEISDIETSQSSDIELAENCTALTKQNEEQLKIIAQLQEDINMSNQQCLDMKNSMDKQNVENLGKIEQLIAQKSELGNQLDESSLISHKLEEEVKNLQNMLSSVEELKSVEITCLKNKVQELKEKNLCLQSQLDSLAESRSLASEESESMLVKLQGQLTESQQAANQLTKTIEELEKSIADQAGMLKTCKADEVKFRAEMDSTMQELGDVRAEVQKSESVIAGLNTQNGELLQTINDLESENLVVVNEMKTIDSEKCELAKQLTQTKCEFEALRLQQCNLLKSEIQNSSMVESLQLEITKSEEKFQQLQSGFDETKSKLQLANQEKQALADERALSAEQLNANKIKLNATIDQLRLENSNELSVIQAQCEELTKKLTIAEKNQAKFTEEQHENIELKKKCDELLETVDTLKGEVEKLTSDYEVAQLKIKNLTANNNEAVTARSELENQLKNYQLETEQLKMKLQAFADEHDASQTKASSMDKVEYESMVKSNNDQEDKIESLEKSLKEKDVYNAKLKALTVKARKELELTKQQLQKVQEEKTKLSTQLTSMDSKLQGTQAHASNVQMMQIECDKLQDEVDLIKEEKQAMQKNIEGLFSQLATEKDEKQGLQTKLETAKADFEKLKKDKSDVEVLLTNSKSTISSTEREKEAVIKEKNSVKQELDAVRIQLTSLTKAMEEREKKLLETEESLKNAKKNMKQHDLMSLEMEEYDKTINDLQSQIDDLEATLNEKSEEVEILEQRNIALQEENRTIENLRINAEDRVTKNKESLDESREEISRLSQVELDLKGQLDVITTQLEQQQQESEQYKLELAGKSAEQRELQEKNDLLRSSSARTIDILERKANGLQMQFDSQRLEFETLSSDYESYKVRVHSVLKQQKSKDTQQTVQPDKTELNQLRQKFAQLQTKLIEKQNILTSREGELDLLQGDYDRLLRQQQQSSESAVEREGRWKTRVKSLQQELMTLRKQHTDLTQKMTQQDELASESIKKELSVMKEEHCRDTNVLRREIEAKDNELCALRNEIRSLQEDKHVSSTPRKPQHAPTHYRLPSVDHSHHVMAAALDYRSVAREDGEGEENPDTTSIVSFEQVLQSPTIKSVTEVSEIASMTSEMQLKQLETKMDAQGRQLEHLSEVARENEAMSARLTDQNRVLKDEIRRLEKNQEREESVANLEYLKNVVYKFVTLPPSDERRHLLPVIDTMLKLSPEERSTLQAIAADDDAPTEGQGSGGWGSYLQRWSGMQ